MPDIEKNRTGVLYSAPNVIRKMNGYYFVVNPEIPNMMVVDDIGKRVLELCQEITERCIVVEKVSAEFDCDEQDVEHFIDSLLKTKFVSVDEPLRVARPQIEARLSCIQLHLTQACNLRCRHCYFSSGIPFENELTDEEYLRFVQNLRDIGITSLTITGGEPFLRRELLFKLLEEASKQGVEHISLSTNGTLLTEEDAHLLKKYNVKTGVSLDGATEETHDYIRGKGVFSKAINTIKMLKKTGVYTTIGFTLMRTNMKEITKMLYLAKEIGDTGIYFNTIRVTGRAKENLTDTYISAEEALAGLVHLWKSSRELGVRTGAEARFNSMRKGVSPNDLCGAGRVLLCVAANGDVYPCDAFLGIDAFRAGNIRNDSIVNIWRDSPALQPFRDIHVDQVEGCRTCELKYICGGGCMEDNYEAHGTLHKVSPFCPALKGICEEMLLELASEMWSKQ